MKPPMPTIAYPPTPRVVQVDDFHGTLVSDPFRWLEDTDSAETRAWIEAQNALTFGFLERIPERERIAPRLTELWDYPKRWAPLRRGDRYFQLRNSGLQNQDVLYVMERLADEGAPAARPQRTLGRRHGGAQQLGGEP